MEISDFGQYRRLFYFFQYAFAVRSNAIYDPFDESNTLNIMHQLAIDTPHSDGNDHQQVKQSLFHFGFPS